MIKCIVSLLFIFFTSFTFASVSIPVFTPNVVDPANNLSVEEREEINLLIEEIRTKADILTAVFVINTLEGEPIEDLADRAFRQWQLGEKGKDNGLLFLIALSDRQSRFEVGYGLEGDLTDIVTFRAQQDEFNPLVKKGQLKNGIINTLNFLSKVKTGEISRKSLNYSPKMSEIEDDFNEVKGVIPWAVFSFFVWVTYPFALFMRKRYARKIASNNSRYDITKDTLIIEKRSAISKFVLPAFFTVNPGVFIFIGSSLGFNWVDYAIFIGCPIIALLIFRSVTKRYRTQEAWEKYIQKLREEKEAYIARGYLEEVSAGVFVPTTKYLESDDYKNDQAKIRISRSSSSSRSWSSSSGSSSSSSSSSRSSSGGGRSGGGGSNSSW